MSEQTTTVRTDELRPGDRVWHPFDIACFTVAHKPEPVALDFEGERGLRVTGTDDRGETVHVDVSPAYKWHRGPKVTAPTTHDPLVVNTKDGVCWTRRTVTSGGIALYAPESVKTCSEFVMATEAELAEHGIVGSAFALPMPVAPEPQEDPVAAGRRLDLLALMDERAASAVSPVLAGVLDEAERLRARVAGLEAQRERRRVRLVACEADLGEMRGLLSPNGWPRRIPPEVEIHERVAPAVEWLLNRVAEVEARLAEYERPADEDPIAYALTEKADAAGYPPALPWAKHLDHEDLTDFLDELAASAITNATSEVALTEVEDTIGRWRVIGEAQHAHNIAPGPDADEPGMRPAVRIIGGDA